jgi:glutathione peroxidase
MKSPLYDIPLQRIDGKKTTLADYAGKVMLIVNVASQCGKTPQYDGLEKLYGKYRDQGLVVLGFPANDFDGQEPGTDEEIQEFCRSIYGVDFPMFSKIAVRGSEQDPLYRTLTNARPTRTLGDKPEPNAVKKLPEKDVRWNFEKFLVSRKGDVVDRFDPDVVPLDKMIVSAVERLLGE